MTYELWPSTIKGWPMRISVKSREINTCSTAGGASIILRDFHGGHRFTQIWPLNLSIFTPLSKQFLFISWQLTPEVEVYLVHLTISSSIGTYNPNNECLAWMYEYTSSISYHYLNFEKCIHITTKCSLYYLNMNIEKDNQTRKLWY